MTEAEKKTLGIVLFPEVEELDFVGPLEVFGALGKYIAKDWQVVTVAETAEPVQATNGLTVVPRYTFADCPALDVLLVPGGIGTREQENNEALIQFVRTSGDEAKWVTSVCTGALILGKAGFLRGRKATTHWAALEQLRAHAEIDVVEQRFVEDGNVITAAGVSAGIDMALYLVGKLEGTEAALQVQKAIEYYPEPPFSEEQAEYARKESR